ncbi:glycoside hydrolase family 3 protein [Mucilaginibacter myungsuensis]|uniref:beta-N-acetylhexosaminidase n=1 Tax=Mucilaginibacter myungsuensis TaxID=649104 RepID=A0A929KXN1_9SPHI|nr:glycoside hydrolase family 3 protein [Mucilaginibacter myungsuensis]MBE9662353.1 glycoside hydrolase family 3 protein [Mucilaginibacter myungsuensis]MDN3599210.1 glycoside hydrolase family 3 protein [Mucilaginibacter myungsuensis]
MRILRSALLILSASAFGSTVFAQTPGFLSGNQKQQHWVDSVFHKLTRKQKVQQLFFVRAHTNLPQRYQDSVGRVIHDEHLGGVVFFQGGPGRQAELTNKYQALSKVPLLISIDGEWGLGMRLDSTISYPYQMTLGAIQNRAIIKKMGEYVAYDLKRLGIHMNFAPVMDVNNNPNNPVINYRSFGDDKHNVAQKGIAYMQGMQDGGILTTAKHFPGHGDTDVDSHYDLPQLKFDKARLDSLEMYPFREAIKAGLSGVMIAHMNIPALDNTKNVPSTLSRPIITGVLKDSLKFKGLIVSDAMEMKGVVKFFPNGLADVKAFIAGNDILELSENSARAVTMIKKAIRHHEVDEKELDEKVKKVLAAKYWAGLNHYKPSLAVGVFDDLNRPEAYALQQELADKAITLLKGDTTLQKLDPLKHTAIVSIGVPEKTVFQQELCSNFKDAKMFIIPKDVSAPNMSAYLKELKGFDQVIVGLHDNRNRPASKIDYPSNLKLMIADLAALPNVVMSLFANPYTIAGMPGIEKSSALLACYQKEAFMQRAAAKVITSKIKAAGKLPVSVNTYFPTGSGIVFGDVMP